MTLVSSVHEFQRVENLQAFVKVCLPNRPGPGARFMIWAGFIVVEDASGAQLQLHEYRGRFFDKRRFVLETGEAVTRVDFDNYLVAKTGEKLVRVIPGAAAHDALLERS